MLAPLVAPMRKLKRETIALGSINYSDNYRPGDLADSFGVSARRWPYLSTRLDRLEEIPAGSGTTAIFGWDGHTVRVAGTELLYDERKLADVTAGPKQFAVVNTKLVIWPDKVYVDVANGESGSLGGSAVQENVSFTADTITAEKAIKVESDVHQRYGGDATSWRPTIYTYGRSVGSINWSKETGWSKPYGYIKGVWVDEPLVRVGDIVIPSYRNGAFHIPDGDSMAGEDPDRSQENTEGYFGIVTKCDGVASISQSEWLVAYDVYKLGYKTVPFADSFKAGDAVEITGAGVNNRKALVITEVTRSPNAIRFSGAAFTPREANGTGAQVNRGVPAMDYICSHDNRLWGCSSTDKQVYASALGDPTNFNLFDGQSTDSWAATIGSEGKFTGIASYNHSVVLFKENELDVIKGDYPAQYYSYATTCEGMRDGCHKSIQVMSGILIYLGIHGVYAYNGGIPYLISPGVGQRTLYDGVGGNDGDSYWLSCRDDLGAKHLFVYEFQRHLWVREDGLLVTDFARKDKDLYLLTEDGSVQKMNAAETSRWMPWMVQSKPLYETVQGRKIVSKLSYRLELPRGSWIEAYIRKDGRGWDMAGRVIGSDADTVPMTIRPGRCDKYEIMLKGQGPCTVLSALREYRIGSDK